MTESEVVRTIIDYMKSDDGSDDAFNEHALFLFKYQFTHNKAYQMYCRKKGKTLRNVKHWTSIPPVPVDAFKELPLTCTPMENAAATFMTSGSTSGIQGKHHHSTLEVYDTSMILNFKKHVMKDNDKMRMAILFPTADKLPHSSLAHYLALAKRTFGTEKSDYYFNDKGITYEALFKLFKEVEQTNEPLLILGASYSFVHLFAELEKENETFALPEGSIIFDTGGYKNQSEELKLDDFYNRLHTTFNVPRSKCINMYGMTELSTQFYDRGNVHVPSLKVGPHWIKSRVINPLTNEKMPKGEKGILVHYDLANINSVTTIMTEDIGIKTDEGFYLLGRAEGVEAKGCSLALDQFVQATKGD